MMISSVFPPPHPSPLLFSLPLSLLPPSLPASSSVIPLSPSVVVLNKQQGVVGRGLHSRWVCESPEGVIGGGRRGGWERDFPASALLPFSRFLYQLAVTLGMSADSFADVTPLRFDFLSNKCTQEPESHICSYSTALLHAHTQ